MLIGQQQQLQKSFNAPVSDYYDGLNNEQRTEFRDHVMAAMDISMATFYYRLRNSGFKGIERQYIIDELIGKSC